MDEFNGQKGSQREPVRSSMVVMTGKLLGVTESIAAMNLRIFAGVVFCIILLVATFVVNVIAFDYAKDQEEKGGALVSKKTGEVLKTQPTLTMGASLRYDIASWIKTEAVVMGNDGDSDGLRVASYKIHSHEVFGCTAGKYCQGGFVMLAYTSNGRTIIAALDHETGKFYPEFVEDPEFLATLSVTASAYDQDDHETRHLLGWGHSGYTDGCLVNSDSLDEATRYQRACLAPPFGGGSCHTVTHTQSWRGKHYVCGAAPADEPQATTPNNGPAPPGAGDMMPTG